jgi:hypothetical protein
MAVATEELTALDVGNVLLMEHLNLEVPNQLEATLFYIVGLGFTRDPYNTVGVDNMHVNVGDSQFHLPTRGEQVLAGHVGVVVPDLDALEKRLEGVQPRLSHTKLAWHRKADHVAVTCPWGNQFRCYAPDPARFGDRTLGIPYIEFQVKPGAAEGIARFYEQVFRTPSRVETNGAGTAAHVQVGRGQELIFRETEGEQGENRGYHVAVYIANFSGPYSFLRERDLADDVRNQQFRFKSIVDPETGEQLHELEHEVRNLFHPQFRRTLVNRDPAAR